MKFNLINDHRSMGPYIRDGPTCLAKGFTIARRNTGDPHTWGASPHEEDREHRRSRTTHFSVPSTTPGVGPHRNDDDGCVRFSGSLDQCIKGLAPQQVNCAQAHRDREWKPETWQTENYHHLQSCRRGNTSTDSKVPFLANPSFHSSFRSNNNVLYHRGKKSAKLIIFEF